MHNEEVANATLFPLAETTYTGSNIAGKVRAFLPNLDTVPGYRAKCAEVAANGFEGLTFATADAVTPV